VTVPIRWHLDDPALLLQAIETTARETSFNPRLIEKDYFCSVVLEYLTAADAGLVFKGGTCLAKVHGSFYRLSEDLDFSISIASDATRSERSSRTARLKERIAGLATALPGCTVLEPLRGANANTQYNATVGYESLLDAHIEPVRVEVGLREPTLRTELAIAKTMVLNPVNGQSLVDGFPILSLSHQELLAEKVRAALCRRDVAIRDFFDVDHVVQARVLDIADREFINLLRQKLSVPGTSVPNVSVDRMQLLQRQLEGELRPVLREAEFASFDLQRATELVRKVAQQLE
jgi:predicted nucleotidyltransferase component of viral defense system